MDDDQKSKKGFLSKVFSASTLKYVVGVGLSAASAFAGAAVIDVTYVDYVHDASNELMQAWKKKVKSYLDFIPHAFFHPDGEFSWMVESFAGDELADIRAKEALITAKEAAQTQARIDEAKAQYDPSSGQSMEMLELDAALGI